MQIQTEPLCLKKTPSLAPPSPISIPMPEQSETRGQFYHDLNLSNATPRNLITAPGGSLTAAPKPTVMVTKSTFGPTVFREPLSPAQLHQQQQQQHQLQQEKQQNFFFAAPRNADSAPTMTTIDSGKPSPVSVRGGSSDSAVNRERTFACDFPNCNKTYLKSSHLKAHFRVHTGETNSKVEIRTETEKLNS